MFMIVKCHLVLSDICDSILVKIFHYPHVGSYTNKFGLEMTDSVSLIFSNKILIK